LKLVEADLQTLADAPKVSDFVQTPVTAGKSTKNVEFLNGFKRLIPTHLEESSSSQLLRPKRRFRRLEKAAHLGDGAMVVREASVT